MDHPRYGSKAAIQLHLNYFNSDFRNDPRRYTMAFRPTRPLALMAFNRPMHILIKPDTVPRVKPTFLGIRIINLPSIAFYHSNTNQLRQDRQKSTHSSPRPSPAPYRNPSLLEQPQAPTDAQMERHIPNFSSLDEDGKLGAIQSKKSFLATESKKYSPKWRPGEYRAVRQALDLKEKEILGKDPKEASRRMTWWPTILVDAILLMIP